MISYMWRMAMLAQNSGELLLLYTTETFAKLANIL